MAHVHAHLGFGIRVLLAQKLPAFTGHPTYIKHIHIIISAQKEDKISSLQE